MREDKQKEITEILGRAKWFLTIGGIVILILPFLMTNNSFCEHLNFSETGQIGDTIGGITAPFMSLIGAFLIFFALKAQVKANQLIQEQIDRNNEDKECENEGQNINQLYSYLTDSINNFHFQSLPKEQLKNIENTETQIEYKGGEAFYHLFSQINCHYHGTQEDLHSQQVVSELLSILKIMNLLLDKLKNTKSKNKEILITLVQHLFDYKIVSIFREVKDNDLNVIYCEDCNCNHGLPDELKGLIFEIKLKLKE